MKQFIALFLLVIILSKGHQVNAQENYQPDKKLDTVALQEDLRILRLVLEKAHIGLYRYTGKTTMDSLFDQCRQQLTQPMTEIEFFKRISPIIVAIRDEHTFAIPSDSYRKNEIGQTAYASSAPESKARLFPFFLRLLNNRLFIDNNLSEDLSLTPGEEITAINGESAAVVIATLLPTIPTNGFIETFRQRHFEEYSLHQTYNRFMVHYAIFIGRPDTFALTIGSKGKRTREVKVAALPASSIFNNYWRRYSILNDLKKRKENPLELSFLPGKTAYLRLSDFHTPVWSKYNYSYSTEYRIFFQQLLQKKTEHLVIDLRGNEGGNPAIGIELLQYLCTSTFRPYNYHEVKEYKFTELKQYFRDSGALPKYADELFIPTSRQTFQSNPQYRTETWSRSMQPSPLVYKKKLYVLVNGATGSAASILATLIRVNRKDAIFIGEECGGDMEGPISGGGTDITLPNSRIKVDIPYIRRVINLNGYPNRKGRGILPDHTVIPTADDLMNNEDTELKFTMNLRKI